MLQHRLVQLLAIWKQISNGAHISVTGHSPVINGAMNKFGICSQWRGETFTIKVQCCFSLEAMAL
jgi:hypothetical protein